MRHNHKLLLFALLIVCLLAIPGSVQAKSGIQVENGTENTKFITNDTYTLKSGETLNSQVFAVDSTIKLEVDSVVNGNVILINSDLSAAGMVNGNIACVNCTGKVLDTAVIHGSIVNPTNKLEVSTKARVTGSTVLSGTISSIQPTPIQSLPTRNQSELGLVSKILGGIFVVLALSALGVLVVLLFPKSTEKVARATTANAGISWGAGILSVFVVIIGMLILSITVILIPVAMLAALVLGIAVLYGWIALGYEIGTRIAASANQKWPAPAAAGIGLIVINVIVVGFVIIPSWVGACISALLIFVIAMFGLGSVVLTRFGTHEYPEKPAIPSTPVPPPAPVPPVMPFVPMAGIPPQPGSMPTPPPMPSSNVESEEKKTASAKEKIVKSATVKSTTTRKTTTVKTGQPPSKPRSGSKNKPVSKATPKKTVK